MLVNAIGKPPGCKLLRIRAKVIREDSGSFSVHELAIRGDFFAVPEEDFEAMGQSIEGTGLDALAKACDDFIQRKGIQIAGISGSAIESLLREAIQREESHELSR